MRAVLRSAGRIVRPGATVLVPLCIVAASGPSRANTSDTLAAEPGIVAPDGIEDDELGVAVAIDGSWAAVGALRGSALVGQAGSVYLYERVAGTWVLRAEVGPSSSVSDEFGRSVALDGDTLAVGADQAAWVFVRVGSSWSEQASFLGSAQFGWAVDVSGDTLIVGDTLNDTAASNAGAAHVYVRSGTSWSQQALLLAGDPATDDWLGSAVAVDGDTVLAGAQQEDSTGFEAGSAYVFVRSGTTWSEQAKLVGSGLISFDRFGEEVALQGDRAFVAAPLNDSNGMGNGAVWVFERSGTSWTETQTLTGAVTGGATESRFGRTLAVDGDRLLVGAPEYDVPIQATGVAYPFARVGSTWRPLPPLQPPTLVQGDRFGLSVAVDGDLALVGAPRIDMGSAENVGVAFPFLYGPETATFCTGKTSSLGCVPFVTFSGTPGVSVTSPFTVQANDMIPGEAAFFLYGFGKANLAFHGGVLCVKAPVTRWQPAKAAAASGPPPCTGVLQRNFNNRIQSGADPALTPGKVVVAQWLQRDPADPAGFGDGLTDGVRFFIRP